MFRLGHEIVLGDMNGIRSRTWDDLNTDVKINAVTAAA